MHKTKEYIKNNILIILLVTIAIVTNIVIVYTSFSFTNNERLIQATSIIETTQKSPIVVEVIDEHEKENNDVKYEEKEFPTGKTKYYIKVNCISQTVNVYEKDENNRYSKPVKVMLCSTGTYTPDGGTYKITTFKKEWLALQGDVYGQYCSQIVGNILFHSVPYLEKGNPASLEYWEYDKLGQNASMGCIRLTVENAKWIYDNCEAGTMVEFYSSENPGPLGKPVQEKISDYSDDLRNWDPTDTNKNNPWIEYNNKLKEKEEIEKKEKEEEQKIHYNAALQATMKIMKLV